MSQTKADACHMPDADTLEQLKSKCGCLSIGKKPNPECFSAACEFCQFCGACNATMKYEKIRFCDAECEQAWKLDEPNA